MSSTVAVTFVYDDNPPTNGIIVEYNSLIDVIEANILRWEFVEDYKSIPHYEQTSIDEFMPPWLSIGGRWHKEQPIYHSLKSCRQMKVSVDKIKEQMEYPTINVSVEDFGYIAGDSKLEVEKEISELWDKIAEVLNK